MLRFPSIIVLAAFLMPFTAGEAAAKCRATGPGRWWCSSDCEPVRMWHEGHRFHLRYRCRRPQPSVPGPYIAPDPEPEPRKVCDPGWYDVGNNSCCPIGTDPDGDYCRERRQHREPLDLIAALGLEGLRDLERVDLLFYICLAAFLSVICLIVNRTIAMRHRTDDVVRHTQSAEDLTTRIAAISKEADELISNYRKHHYNRGRYD